ncbi:hypothetical protein Droror1_Dr00023558 [Drosera rotundifolia]
MVSGGMNLVMTTMGFSVSTLFIVFVCTRLICARIQPRLARRSLRFAASSRSDLSSMERGLHGLEPVVIASFPVKKYSNVYFSSAVNAQCSVCLAEYIPDDVLRILPYCGHFFHVNCIDIWLLQHCTCPICRISLRDVNEKKRVIQPIFSSRSHFGFDSPAVHSHHCLLADHICTTRPQGNNRVADSSCGTSSLSSCDAEEAGENTPSGERLSGDGTSKPSESKDVESPSS